MPLSEHMGSHSAAAQEHPRLHSEKSISLVGEMIGVLEDEEGFFCLFLFLIDVILE